MASEVRFNQIFNYWWEDLKWSGVFDINWVYIKDVHHQDLKHVTTKEGQPISVLKDGNEIDFDAGKLLLDTFKSYPHVSDIFEDFAMMDQRERVLRMKRDSYYQIFKLLNEKGFIEESKGEKGGDKKPVKGEVRSARQEGKSGRSKFKNSDVYYERKEQGES